MGQSLQEQLRDYRQLGVVVIEAAITGEQLELLQAATDHWHGQFREEWLDQIDSGDACPLWFDVPDALERDEVFVEMVDHPSYIDLLEAITDGQLLLDGTLQVRAIPPWPVSYTGWHPDRARSEEVGPKLQIYINDVPSNGGEFAYVPGSHKTCTDTRYRPQRNNTMPGHMSIPGKAGTAILFDNAGLHTAMDNYTATRKSMIIGYRQGRLEAVDDRFLGAAKWCHTSRRRRLLGLEV